MPLNEQEIILVRESFDRLEPDLDTHSEVFYNELFKCAPELRGMFRDDLAGQGMKFMTTLRQIIRHIHDRDRYRETLRELGKGHAILGVEAQHFRPLEQALIKTISDELGDDFSPDHEAAWRKAIADVSQTMITEGGMS